MNFQIRFCDAGAFSLCLRKPRMMLMSTHLRQSMMCDAEKRHPTRPSTALIQRLARLHCSAWDDRRSLRAACNFNQYKHSKLGIGHAHADHWRNKHRVGCTLLEVKFFYLSVVIAKFPSREKKDYGFQADAKRESRQTRSTSCGCHMVYVYRSSNAVQAPVPEFTLGAWT